MVSEYMDPQVLGRHSPNLACHLTSFTVELLLEFPMTKIDVVLLIGIVSNTINPFDGNPYP